VRWVSEPDRGQTEAINKGWKQTTGDIVAWLNADDFYYPGALRQVAAFLDAHPDVDGVYGDCDYVDPAGRHLRPYPARPYDYLLLVREARDFIPQPATFVRRRVLESVGLLDESLHFVMDFEYWLRLGLRHTLAYLPVRLAATRLHPEAKSVKSGPGFAREIVQVYERLFARSDLPASVRRVRDEAMGNAYYEAAARCFWEGAPREARVYAGRCWEYAQGGRRRALLAMLVLGSLGRAGAAVAAGARRVVPRKP
jgi:glycosyltransferase involved in cell wall biosynthesis